jgi:hypothetical protein
MLISTGAVISGNIKNLKYDKDKANIPSQLIVSVLCAEGRFLQLGQRMGLPLQAHHVEQLSALCVQSSFA